jgi:hypothetical protein
MVHYIASRLIKLNSVSSRSAISEAIEGLALSGQVTVPRTESHYRSSHSYCASSRSFTMESHHSCSFPKDRITSNMERTALQSATLLSATSEVTKDVCQILAVMTLSLKSSAAHLSKASWTGSGAKKKLRTMTHDTVQSALYNPLILRFTERPTGSLPSKTTGIHRSVVNNHIVISRQKIVSHD